MPNNFQLNNTKILATLGPSIDSKATLKALVEAGANVFRLNFSHGNHEDHRQRHQWIREVEKELNKPIGILMDLQGPKLRVSTFAEGKATLVKGQSFRFDLSKQPGNAERVYLPHPEIIAASKPGMHMLVDDGLLRLEVTASGDDFIDTQVITGGVISDRKGVNVPDAVLDLSPLSDKDKADLQFGLEIGVDWVALSFVQRPEDVTEAKDIIGTRAKVMAKIEKPSAIDMLDEIIRCADGIMVARGDLGVELPLEKLPGIQKSIIIKCRQQGKPVVVATQMLESMRTAPTPTRAEVTDVANAVYDGADAVMLSAETASGSYPVETVTTMSKIIAQVERDPGYRAILDAGKPEPEATATDAISSSLRRIASILPLAAIVNYTYSGISSQRESRERPEAPVLSLTPSIHAARLLTLSWGSIPVYEEKEIGESQLVAYAMNAVKAKGIAKAGDIIAITIGTPARKPGWNNVLRIEEVIA